MNAATTYNRFILTGIGGSKEQVVVFPDAFVSSIIVVDRSSVMAVPFYDRAIAGLIHHQGAVIPLVILRRVFGELSAMLSETFSVVHLSALAGGLEGVGVVVDRVLSSVPAGQYTASPDHLSVEALMAQLPLQLWQPQRWHSYSPVQ